MRHLFLLLNVVLAVSVVAPVFAQIPSMDPVEAEPTVQAVKKVLPAVVNINTERTIRKKGDKQLQSSEEFPNKHKGGKKVRQQSLGSGFVVDPEGYIITNEHVVARAADMKIQVTFQDGTTLGAVYITGDAKSDLALIKVDAGRPLPFIDLTDLSPNHLGQTIIAVGNPLGYESTITRGVLSGKARSVTIEDIEYSNLLQTDAAINPGNSGGPLIDISGRLVGLSSVKMAFTPDGMPAQGMGFAIPGDFVQMKVEEFERAGPSALRATPVTREPPVAAAVPNTAIQTQAARISWERFGMQIEDSPTSVQLDYDPGVVVGDVEPGSPADMAGIKRGLVIYKVGRYEVKSTKDIEPLFQRIKTGTVIDIAVGIIARQGDELRQKIETVTLKAR